MPIRRPARESERLEDLQTLALLDSPRDPAFDDLVSLAAEWCEVPIAAIGLIDAKRQWFKACCGFDSAEIPREQSFCTHAILKPDALMQVPDARLDARFADIPLVTGAPGARFYAGVPLLSSRGHAVGTLCVIDTRPRELTPSQRHALTVLARQVGVLIELQRKRAQLEQQQRFLRTVIDSLHEGVAIFDGNNHLILSNQSANQILGLPFDAHIGKMPPPAPSNWLDIQGQPIPFEHMPAQRTLRTGEVLSDIHTRLLLPDGSELALEHNTRPMMREGRIDGVVVSFRDVTEKIAALQRLRASEARLRGITDNVPALIAYVDGRQHLQFFNRVAQDWVRRTHEQVLGQPLETLMGEAEYAGHREHVLAALAGQRREFGLWSSVPGEPRFLQFSYVPDCCDQGTVKGFFVLASDQTAMKKLEIQLAAEARFDVLTGLPNRRHFHEELEQALRRAQRHGTRLALGFLDLDGFKQINDVHGHAIGDAVLKEFGRRLRAAVRQTDFVARLAGDEFTVLLEDVHQAHELDPLAQKILAASRAPLDLTGGLRLTPRTSLGLALAGSGERAAELVERADAAMYRAKSQGRDTYVIVS
jgi:diguanylate cyclase